MIKPTWFGLEVLAWDLESAPLKIFGSILPTVNFGGLVWLLQKKKKLYL